MGQALQSIEGLPVRGRITVKPLLVTDHMLLLETAYEAGAGAPLHRHEHESICYVVRGRMRTTVQDRSWELGPGDSCVHSKGVLHALEAIEESVVVEIKSPAPDPSAFLGLGSP
jgi:quercetin dioxygenase-like cupin family protein